MRASLRQEFLLKSDIKYLNHGSFGACPKPVFKAYQDWQLALEQNPIDYYTRQLEGLFTRKVGGPLETARTELAEFVGADSEGLIFTPNVTVALNAIAHSIHLDLDDEVLTTDHEYGTILATWQRKCKQSGASLVQVPIELPVADQQDFVEQFWSQVKPNTKVILMSHITSATALVLPVQEICERARAAGIITIIDGAHAVGQLELNLVELGADFYTSNCHKWLLTPKGTALLYVHPSQRDSFEPLVISWAEINEPSFALRHDMWGTRDMAGFLSIPAALEFRRRHNWDEVSRTSRKVVYAYREKFATLFERGLICDESWLAQMSSVLLPAATEPIKLWKYLWSEHQIEAMVTQWRSDPILRLGFNGYNTTAELDDLYNALSTYLKS